MHTHKPAAVRLWAVQMPDHGGLWWPIVAYGGLVHHITPGTCDVLWPASKLALAANNAFTARPSRTRCNGVRPCESPDEASSGVQQRAFNKNVEKAAEKTNKNMKKRGKNPGLQDLLSVNHGILIKRCRILDPATLAMSSCLRLRRRFTGAPRWSSASTAGAPQGAAWCSAKASVRAGMRWHCPV